MGREPRSDDASPSDSSHRTPPVGLDRIAARAAVMANPSSRATPTPTARKATASSSSVAFSKSLASAFSDVSSIVCSGESVTAWSGRRGYASTSAASPPPSCDRIAERRRRCIASHAAAELPCVGLSPEAAATRTLTNQPLDVDDDAADDAAADDEAAGAGGSAWRGRLGGGGGIMLRSEDCGAGGGSGGSGAGGGGGEEAASAGGGWAAAAAACFTKPRSEPCSGSSNVGNAKSASGSLRFAAALWTSHASVTTKNGWPRRRHSAMWPLKNFIFAAGSMLARRCVTSLQCGYWT